MRTVVTSRHLPRISREDNIGVYVPIVTSQARNRNSGPLSAATGCNFPVRFKHVAK